MPKAGTVSLFARLKCAVALLTGLRRHDLRAARTWINTMYPGVSLPARLWRFVCWSLGQMFVEIPNALRHVTWERPVAKVPIWLADGNPLANHPWQDDPQTDLPKRADVVVIGAGFTGAALAYHWSKLAPKERSMVVVDLGDPASGSSGRNEGLVVMGRYYAMVVGTVLPYLEQVKGDLAPEAREKMAHQFAAAYAHAAYRNADMIEQTIRKERFDCDYARKGWVQARNADDQSSLAESVRMGLAAGFDDWTQITPDEVRRRCGMHVEHNAGFSLAAASFHPAKWVWCLFNCAIRQPNVQLYTRTRVTQIEDAGEHYRVQTERGTILARHVVNATESYTPLLHRQFHDRIQPTQTQAAFGTGGPDCMQPEIGISSTRGFFGRHEIGVMAGSDATRVPDREAGRMQPSRFITKFLVGEMQRHFGSFQYHVTHEWSGTVGYTPDEYPVVGVFDGNRQYVIGGMAGSGTAVSFNAGRCVCRRILELPGDDDYPEQFFAPSRLLDPKNHPWPPAS